MDFEIFGNWQKLLGVALFSIVAMWLSACGGDGSENLDPSDSDSTTDSGTDSDDTESDDTDSDVDAGMDAGMDAGTDSDTGSDTPTDTEKALVCTICLEGLCCYSCMITAIETLSALPGVISVDVVYNETATITYWPDSGTTGDDMVNAMLAEGYISYPLSGDCAKK